MTSSSPSNEPDVVNLSEEEKARIRAEVRYAIGAAKAACLYEEPKTQLEKVISSLERFFSNNAVSLLLGAILAIGTGFITQQMQQNAENQKQQTKLLGDLIEHFNLYSDTIEQEYLTILNLCVKNKLNELEYYDYLQKLGKIRSQRNNEYSKIQTLAYLTDNKPIINAKDNLYSDYTKKIDQISENIYNDVFKLYLKTHKLKKDVPNPDANYFTNLLNENVTSLRKQLKDERSNVQALIAPNIPKTN